MKKKLTVPQIDTPCNLHEAETVLQGMKRYAIDTVNWDEFPAKPQVEFTIAHNHTAFYLYFEVKKEKVRAVVTETNGEVYEDSCCEFFFAPDSKGYYNVEVNALGTCLVGYGIGHDRKRLDKSVIEQIETKTSLGALPVEASEGKTEWHLTVMIPFSVFRHHPEFKFTENSYGANFYKCGDKTPVTHFLSWNPIATEKPNFHVIDHFGEILIEK